MRIAVLIHVHTNPEQVALLVSKLRHAAVDIYINVDKKTDIELFTKVVKNVTFVTNRVEVVWGRFSQVEQILNSFREIIKQRIDYSHVLFISGLDYPVKPISEIVKQIETNKGFSFIDYHELKQDDWSVLMRKRYEYWHFLPSGDIRNNKWVKKLIIKSGFKRKYPFDKTFYGSCWFCLSLESIQYLLDYSDSQPDVINFFKYSGCSDELFIQSVLLNSPLKDKMINQIYRYFDWSNEGKSPKILTYKDFDKISNTNNWFARKLDIHTDSKLFSLLDSINTDDNGQR